MNNRDSIRPPASYYWFASTFIVIGVGLFIYTLIRGISGLTGLLTQVVVPGDVDLSLKKDTPYAVFLEEESFVNGKIYVAQGSVNGLTCTTKSKRTGDMINMREPGYTAKYNPGNRSGHSVLSFGVPEDGVYEFACKYPEATKGSETVVAVGSGVGEGILKTLFTGLASLFGGMLFAGCVIITVLLLRERAKKKWVAPVQPLG